MYPITEVPSALHAVLDTDLCAQVVVLHHAVQKNDLPTVLLATDIETIRIHLGLSEFSVLSAHGLGLVPILQYVRTYATETTVAKRCFVTAYDVDPGCWPGSNELMALSLFVQDGWKQLQSSLG